MKNRIIEYVRTMFAEGRDGELTVGDAGNQFDCSVQWDEETAYELAERCGTLLVHLTELSMQYDKLRGDTRHLTQEQLDVWNTYLRPFPRHNLDMEALQAVWEKYKTSETLTKEELELSDRFIHWFEENAATRLPVMRCHPALLINRAKYYCKLIRLDAPATVQENAAKRFAEEFVLYHCLKR